MSDKNFRLLRGDAASNDAHTGEEGTLTYDRDAKNIRVHDGVTAGGHSVGIKDAASADVKHVRVNGQWVDINTIDVDLGSMDAWLSKYELGAPMEGGVYAGSYVCEGKEHTMVVSPDFVDEAGVLWSTLSVEKGTDSDCNAQSNMDKLANVRWAQENAGIFGENVTTISFSSSEYYLPDGEFFHEWVIVGYSDKPTKIFRSLDWSVIAELTQFPNNPTSAVISPKGERVALGYGEAPYIIVSQFTVPGTFPTDPITFGDDLGVEGDTINGPVLGLSETSTSGYLLVVWSGGVLELNLDNFGRTEPLPIETSSGLHVVATETVTSGVVSTHNQNDAILAAVYNGVVRVENDWGGRTGVELPVDGAAISVTSSSPADAAGRVAYVHTGGNKYTVYDIAEADTDWVQLDAMPALGNVTPVDCAFDPSGQYLLVATSEAPYLMAVDILNRRVIQLRTKGPVKRLEYRFNKEELYILHVDGTVSKMASGREYSVTKEIPASFWGFTPGTDYIGWSDLKVTRCGRYLLNFIDGSAYDIETLEVVGTQPFDVRSPESQSGRYIGTGALDSGDGKPYIIDTDTWTRVDTVAASADFGAVGDYNGIWEAHDGNVYLVFDIVAGEFHIYNMLTAERLVLTTVLTGTIDAEPQIVNDRAFWITRGHDSNPEPSFFFDVVADEIAFTPADQTSWDRGWAAVGDTTRDGQYVVLNVDLDVMVVDGRTLPDFTSFYVYDTTTWTEVTFQPQRNWTWKAMFSRDGEYLITDSDYDPMCSIYRTSDWAEIARIPRVGVIYGVSEAGDFVFGYSDYYNRYDWYGEVINFIRPNEYFGAGQVAHQYDGDGYSDWMLPTTDQLAEIQQNLPDLVTEPVWTSREMSATEALASDGVVEKDSGTRRVLAIRVFEDTE